MPPQSPGYKFNGGTSSGICGIGKYFTQWDNGNKFILRKLHNRFGGIDKRFVKFETEFNRVDASLDRVLRMTEGFDAPTLQLVHGAGILKKWIEIQDKMKPPTFAAGIHQQLWVAQIVTLLNYLVYWVFKNWTWLITTEPQILFGAFCSFISTLLTLLWKGKTEAAGPVKE